MKVSYSKINALKFFGLKIFQWTSNYIEHSSDKEDNDDDFYISLQQEKIKRSK